MSKQKTSSNSSINTHYRLGADCPAAFASATLYGSREITGYIMIPLIYAMKITGAFAIVAVLFALGVVAATYGVSLLPNEKKPQFLPFGMQNSVVPWMEQDVKPAAIYAWDVVWNQPSAEQISMSPTTSAVTAPSKSLELESVWSRGGTAHRLME